MLNSFETLKTLKPQVISHENNKNKKISPMSLEIKNHENG
jgi:hypothetical protein